MINYKLEKIDAMNIENLTNIRYLTGFTGTYAFLILGKKKSWFFTDSRYTTYAKKLLSKDWTLIDTREIKKGTREKFLQKNGIKTIGFESDHVSVEQYGFTKKLLTKTKLKPIKNFVEDMRIVKTETELKKLKKAQQIAEKTLEEITKKYLKNGVTEKQIAWEIERIGHELGADTISFAPIIGFGANSAVPHHQNTDKKFKKGDVILIDMGMKYQGYCSDMTRTFFTAKPTPLQQKIYNLVLEAQEMGIQKMRAGVTGAEIDKIARDHITAAGYGKNFDHSYGHGIGLEVHEAPSVSTNAKNKIPEGTIITAEPGIYLEGQFGVRIEDMCLIHKDRAENLTKSPKKLSQICIS
ncbi:MAG: Xaa-Pro peptidase family protein [Patescibacteria group bacterium]